MGSNPITHPIFKPRKGDLCNTYVAQLVERTPDKGEAGGSIPSIRTRLFRDSSAAEPPTVNRLVTGSIPVPGAKFKKRKRVAQ